MDGIYAINGMRLLLWQVKIYRGNSWNYNSFCFYRLGIGCGNLCRKPNKLFIYIFTRQKFINCFKGANRCKRSTALVIAKVLRKKSIE